MGAGASQQLAENCANLTDDEVRKLEEKYAALKAKGVSGAGLVQQICDATQDIGTGNQNTGEAEESSPEAIQAKALADARKRISRLTTAVCSEAFSNFLIGIDGGKSSDLAMEVCLLELMKSRDNIMVMHATDRNTVKNLDPSMRPEAIRERTEVRLTATLPKSRYKLIWTEKREDKNIKACILREVNSMTSSRSKLPQKEKPSYFVSGITGRKGARSIGQLALLAVGHFEIPNIIVKMPPITDRPRVFVASVKHLSRMEPLHIALDLMKPGKGDKLIVLHVYSEMSYQTADEVTKVLENYHKLFNNLISADGIDTSGSKFLPIEDKGGKVWSDDVLEVLDQVNADYVLLNPSIHLVNDMEDNATIENCKKIITKAECNVVVCNH